jgi:hypothetical protein
MSILSVVESTASLFHMKLNSIVSLRAFLLLPFLIAVVAVSNTAHGQAAVEPPVAYSSVSQLNDMLTELEQASQGAQGDLSKLRIEKWKTDSSNKRQTASNVESIQRNLHSALPAMITELRGSPESLPTTFKLYRNLDALYDVFSSVVELAGAFGSKDEFQSLDNDLSVIEKTRRTFADRMETLAGAKETELTRLRAQVKTGQVAASPQTPKKVIVDDTEPPKKPVRKRVPKPPAANSSSPATPTPAKQ